MIWQGTDLNIEGSVMELRRQQRDFIEDDLATVGLNYFTRAARKLLTETVRTV